MVSNICIVGLLKNYVRKVAKRVADALDMFYADVQELLSYDFINLVEAEALVGKEYIEKQEGVKIKTVASYENTVITLNWECLNKEKNLKAIKKGAVLVYLRVGKTEFKNKLEKEDGLVDKTEQLKLFKEHDDLLKNYADVVALNKGTIDDVVNIILKKIEEYYENW